MEGRFGWPLIVSFFIFHYLLQMLWFILIGLSALGVSAWYTYHWDLFFNSDFAMVGLVGQRILETGEQFIFVPKVGYQGLLIEGNLSALLFKVLGTSPQVLHLTAVIAFTVFLASYFFALRVWFDLKVACISTFLMCWSSPLFFEKVLRTQPNYPETFALGCALFLLYKKLLHCFRPYRFGLFAFICGFGFYLYGQIAFFLGSVLLSLLGLLPVKQRWFFIRFSLLGSLALLIPSDFFSDFSWKGVPIFMGISLLGPLQLGWIHRKRIKLFISQFYSLVLTFLGCFLVGYSPAIYYRITHQSQVSSHINFVEFSEVVWRNAQTLALFFDDFMVSAGPILLSSGLCVAVLGFFIFYLTRNLFVRLCVPYNPFWILGILILVGFLFAKDAGDAASVRYTLGWQLVFNLVIASLLVRLAQNKLRLALIMGSLFLVFRVSAHLFLGWPVTSRRVLNTTSAWNELQPIADYLKAQHISAGYADYWAAYLTTFCTRKAIILEPLSFNYLPFFEKEVNSQNRIALVKSNSRLSLSPVWPNSDNTFLFRGHRYRIENTRHFPD
ncbi:MAG: hypothetical protein EBZ49_14930, partial [Proteobacteria bacterium]|nr:hypothetical protein [Pseudomonadota bacterium]